MRHVAVTETTEYDVMNNYTSTSLLDKRAWTSKYKNIKYSLTLSCIFIKKDQGW